MKTEYNTKQNNIFFVFIVEVHLIFDEIRDKEKRLNNYTF